MINILLHPKLPYNLDATLNCGQAFRWEKISSNNWLGILKYGLFEVKYEDKCLIIKGVISSKEKLSKKRIEKYLADYFNIDFDHNEFEKSILGNTPKKNNELIGEILNFSKGLRVLNQDPFETAISYLFSIQSNIPLIKRRIKELSRLFTENKIIYKNSDYYFFPSIKQLNKLSMEKIKSLKLGFREKYLIKFIDDMDPDLFRNIENENIEKKKK
ncbi:hypothetical protein J7L48_04035, partial [bacterium]|nr:hypothetical protein [bacterium]